MNKWQQESKFNGFHLSMGVCSIISTSTKVGFEKRTHQYTFYVSYMQLSHFPMTICHSGVRENKTNSR